jgi:hypothetical protein
MHFFDVFIDSKRYQYSALLFPLGSEVQGFNDLGFWISDW